MPFLYGGLRNMGVPRRSVLPNVPPVGHARAYGADGWRHYHSPVGVFLVRDRPQHRRAHIAVRVRRGDQIRAELPDQLGRADVLR